MSKLIIFKFSDLYTMSSGISSKPEQAGHGSPFASFSTIYNNYFLPDALPDLMDTNEREQESYSIKKGDIFLTRTSETLDELAMSCIALKDYPKATYSGFVKRLRPINKEKTSERYMGFYLRSKFFRKTMTNNAIMTLRASLNEEIFSYLKLYLPDYSTQNKIGDFLFLLNSKIELNKRINTELEAMAKMVYDYWFVQFDFPDRNGKPFKTSGGKMVWNEELKREIPDGWMVAKVSSKLRTLLGGTPSRSNSSFWNNGNIPWLSSGEVANFPIVASNEFITSEGLNNSAAKLLKSGSIMISITGNIRVSILGIDACANQPVIGIEQNSELKNSYFYYFILNHIQQYEALMTGAVQKHINKEVIDSTPILIPPTDILKQYYNLADPILNKILITATEVKEIVKLRDWLLPMLMNGQVKVS